MRVVIRKFSKRHLAARRLALPISTNNVAAPSCRLLVYPSLCTKVIRTQEGDLLMPHHSGSTKSEQRTPFNHSYDRSEYVLLSSSVRRDADSGRLMSQPAKETTSKSNPKR